MLRNSEPAVALITSCGPAYFHLLEPFVEHYRRCGVSRFFINIHFDSIYPEYTHAGHCEAAESILSACGEKIYSIYARPFDAMSVREHHEAIQLRLAKELEWIVWADIDEFHEFHVPLPELVRHMDKHGFDYATGKFVDRMARVGFPKFVAGDSIWCQFPLGTDMTRSVVKGLHDKVVLSRASVTVIPGHHAVREGQGVRAMPGNFAVHHFKWDAGVLDRLKRRLLDDWRVRCKWWIQSERTLVWMDNSPLEAFPGLRVFDFKDDEMFDGGGPFSTNCRYMRNGGAAFANETTSPSWPHCHFPV